MSLVYTVPATTTAAAAGKSRNSVYIGGRAEAKSLEKLQRWGISRILNVTPAKETSIQVHTYGFSMINYDCDAVCDVTVLLYPSPNISLLLLARDFAVYIIIIIIRLECRTFSKSPANSCTNGFRCTMLPRVRQLWKGKHRKLYPLFPMDCFMEVFWCIAITESLDRQHVP